ncbi:cellulose binding domain-containing protein [Streptosporangiaceae bacterium NEAU-GS5]|nr:cellulose binding domain-containing protein [Streptosporangiaceae bacterium NEAU-GS5]
MKFWKSPAAIALGAILLLLPSAPAGALVTSATYTMNANWGFGFQALITVTPGVSVTSWTIEFDAADQQAVTNAFYAGFTQTGRHVTLTNRSFNGSVAAGSTLNVGIQFNNPALINVPPPSITFNGQPAAYSPQPYILASAGHVAVPEGGSATFGVTLSQPPTQNVVVTTPGGSTAAVVASPATLTFTAANWNVPQTVTLTSPEDADATGQAVYVPLNQQTGRPFYATDVVIADQIDND